MKTLGRMLVLALALVCLCSGCVNTPGLTESVPTTTGIRPEDTGTATDPSDTTAPEDVDITIKPDGWTNQEDPWGRLGLFANGGYYHCAKMGSEFLSFLDTTNGISVVLCARAGCKHYDEPTAKKMEACDAYLHHSNQFLHIYGDKLYYTGTNDYNQVVLYSRNHDGTGKQTVAELGLGYATPQSSARIYYYIPSGRRLYYKVEMEGSVRNEDGSSTVTIVKRALMCFDLDTKKEVLIEEFVEDAPHMIAARDDQLLYYSAKGLRNLDSTAPDYFEKLKKIPVCLRVWDAETGQSQDLFEKLHKEWDGNGTVSDGKLYFYGAGVDEEGKDCTAWYTYDLETGQTDASDALVNTVNGRYVFSGTSEKGSQVYDIQTGAYLDNAYAERSLRVIEAGDEGMILRISYDKKIEENFWESEKLEYAYVPYATLEDGLQVGDCMVFYTLDYDNQ